MPNTKKMSSHPSDEAKSGNKVSSRITEGSKATLFDPQLLLKLGYIQVPSRGLGTTHYLNAVDARHSSEWQKYPPHEGTLWLPLKMIARVPVIPRSLNRDILLFIESRKVPFKFVNLGFPGGPVVKNLPANAADRGLIPGFGTKIPHASEQLSLSATITEAAVWSPQTTARE